MVAARQLALEPAAADQLGREAYRPTRSPPPITPHPYSFYPVSSSSDNVSDLPEQFLSKCANPRLIDFDR